MAHLHRLHGAFQPFNDLTRPQDRPGEVDVPPVKGTALGPTLGLEGPAEVPDRVPAPIEDDSVPRLWRHPRTLRHVTVGPTLRRLGKVRVLLDELGGVDGSPVVPLRRHGGSAGAGPAPQRRHGGAGHGHQVVKHAPSVQRRRRRRRRRRVRRRRAVLLVRYAVADQQRCWVKGSVRRFQLLPGCQTVGDSAKKLDCCRKGYDANDYHDCSLGTDDSYLLW